MESSSSVIELFQPLLIPGFLQDEEYARAVLWALGGFQRCGGQLLQALQLLAHDIAPADPAMQRRLVQTKKLQLRVSPCRRGSP